MFKKLLLSVVLMGFALHVQAQDPVELVLYSWTDYVDQSVIDDFEKKFNAKVKLVNFQSSDDRDATFFRTNGKGYDVFMLSTPDVKEYAGRGWLLPLGKEKVPNLQYVDEKWINGGPKTEQFAVPYLWGTTGIIYRSDLVKQEITSWKQFYQPEPYLKGKIMVLDVHRSAIGLALKSLGYSFNSTSLQELNEVEKLLLAQKPYVQAYGYLQVSVNTGIVSGKIWMGQAWNGDALGLQEQNSAIRYVVPKEGSEVWIDYFVVSSQTQNPQLATQFVNFIQEPENNARCAEQFSYAATNTKAKQFLSEQHLNNPIIYPDETTLANSEIELTPQSARVQRKLVTIWSKVTRNKN